MNNKKIIAIVIVVCSIMLSSYAFYIYQVLFTPNIQVDKADTYFKVSTGTTFSQLCDRLYERDILSDPVSFSVLAKLKSLDENVKPGLFLLKKDMSNLQAIHLLRSGKQTSVRLTFSGARKLEELPAVLSLPVEVDSAEMACVILHDTIPAHYGFDKTNFISMFIPNTYEVYWTSSPKDILNRMHREYKHFWNEQRIKKMNVLRMSKQEVSVLASIVQAETNKLDEATTISGVYINRIKKKMPLQADPTVVFALGDFSVQRVLNKHKQIDSPYNTYKNRGLPPGPIKMPNPSYIDAVLNYEKHNFLYFCAKEDFSGYHVFATNLIEHNKNAKRFQQVLDKAKIY